MVRPVLVVCSLVAAGGLGVAGCAGEPATEPPREALTEEATVQPEDIAEARELIMREHIGEAREASTQGENCRAYCAAAYTAACVQITLLCRGAEVITLGGATVECVVAIAAVCISGAALGSYCRGQCPP